MRSPSGVVLSMLDSQIMRLSSISSEREWKVSQLGRLALCNFFLFLQNLAFELGFQQRCQLERESVEVQKETISAAQSWAPATWKVVALRLFG